MSNLSSVINENSTQLKGAAFHYKMTGILMYIFTGFCAITIIYIPFAVLYFFLGKFMMKASLSVNNIIGVSELTQDDFNTNSTTAIVELKKYFKAMNIMFIVSMVFLLLALIILLITGVLFAKNLESQYSNPTLNSKYQANLGNKTAEQMGMSQSDHDMLHDPKNIVNTDYSQLDYGNDKAMTAEEKAAMEKIMKGITDQTKP